jgi:hypothetical protein
LKLDFGTEERVLHNLYEIDVSITPRSEMENGTRKSAQQAETLEKGEALYNYYPIANCEQHLRMAFCSAYDANLKLAGGLSCLDTMAAREEKKKGQPTRKMDTKTCCSHGQAKRNHDTINHSNTN